jgi:hypothetical protein
MAADNTSVLLPAGYAPHNHLNVETFGKLAPACCLPTYLAGIRLSKAIMVDHIWDEQFLHGDGSFWSVQHVHVQVSCTP